MKRQAEGSSAADSAPVLPGATDVATRLWPSDDFDRDVWCVLGLPIDRVTLAAAAEAVERSATSGRRLFFITPNVNWLVRASREKTARAQTIEADLSLADGSPVVALARFLGAPLPERVAGSDLFEALRARARAAGRGVRIFFFGGRPGAAAAAAKAIASSPCGLVAAGALDPGQGDLESMCGDETIATINAAIPDFVVVSLGAAKGNAWIVRNRFRLHAPVIAHLGAVVDFTAGTIRRAPNVLRRLGLEWAWRIGAEPGLWRRYAGDGLALARIFFTQVLPETMLARTPGSPGPLGARLDRNGRALTLTLSGDLVMQNREQVRRVFREAAAQSGPIVVDLSGAKRIDRAFLGLLLMLEKHTNRQGRSMVVTGLRPSICGLFRRNGFALAGPNAPDPSSRYMGKGSPPAQAPATRATVR